MRTTAQLVRGYRGPAVWSFGFRPFFLLAAIFAALALPLWVAALAMGGSPGETITRDWHVHEMLWGYSCAVIAGYMAIAGANWTGHFPVTGRRVMLCVGFWLAGRVAMAMPGLADWVRATADCSFLVMLSAALWREHAAAPALRSVAPVVAVTLLALSNIGFHCGAAFPGLAQASERLALGAITLLIAVMGGRLVPSFTRNWLAPARKAEAPAEYGPYDRATVAMVVLGLGSWQIAPHASASGALLLGAGIMSAVRLARWRGVDALAEPLVWMLHAGYSWLALGLALLGGSIMLPKAVPTTSAIHALTAGAIGVMTLALMTRTTYSHTGRERRAGRAPTLAFVLVNAAAAMRVLAPFWAERYLELLFASACLWSAAFAVFLLVCGPMLVTPRVAAPVTH